MNTHLAPPERAEASQLAHEISAMETSALIDALLASVVGMVAVLNEQRQVVALNETAILELGITDPAAALGLRPGEITDCVHADEPPAGCGTTPHCATCGAVGAIVAALETDEPAERTCALQAKRPGGTVDIVLRVRASTVRIGDERFVLLFLQDITDAERRAALERTFFHDVKNMLASIVMASSLLADGRADEDLPQIIHDAAMRIDREIQIQSYLGSNRAGKLWPTLEETTVGALLEELMQMYANHPASVGKEVRLREPYATGPITTDPSLVIRVLANMVTNALEATEPGGFIEVRAERTATTVEFCVRNASAIPEPVQLRVFQRNFSTKGSEGRGLGTFSMKVLGEESLGGRVCFTSSEAGGTEFCLSLPA